MDQIAIGKFIARKRKEKNYTQEALAEKLSVSPKTVSKWECGKCMPDYSIVESLCSELEITLSELMDGEEEEKSIRCITNEEIMELLKSRDEKCFKKKLLIGIVFSLSGIMLLITFFVLRNDLDGFALGLLPTLGTGFTIVGICFIVYYLIKKKGRK